MKTLNKFFYALLALATVGMVACSEDTTTFEPGPQEVEGCYGVYFPDAEACETQGPLGEVSVDPSEATEYVYTAYRTNTEGAITVPVNVALNTESMFTVSALEFADGADVAEFSVVLSPDAEVGKPYTLSLSIDDPQYVTQYESANSNAVSVTITRVKWIDVGECMYTEDVLTSWWGFTFDGAWAGMTHPSYKVKVQVRADSINEAAFQAALDGTGSDAGLSGVYRLVNAYRVGPWGDPSDPSLETDPVYTIIYANPYNRAYIPLQELGIAINGGESSVYSMVGYLIDSGAEADITEDMYGYFKNGTLQFPVQALVGCPGGSYVGNNTYYANGDGAFALTIAPALGKYELVLPEGYNDNDFAFEEMTLPEEALFYSESQTAAWYPILEKGVPAVTTDEADREFVSTYGYMYRLPDLYEFEYPIYFAAKGNKVTLPAQYAEQATGLMQNGYEVLMAIDPATSKFDAATGLLTLVAEFYSYQGDYAVSYGVYEEVIAVEAPEFPVAPTVDIKSDFTYGAMFTDKLKSQFQDGEWEATLEKGICTNSAGAELFEKEYGTAYRIPSMYAQGYDIYFVADADGVVSVPVGYEVQDSGLSIYGKRAFISIRKGSMAKNGVVLNVAITDAEGAAIMPYLNSESLLTYTWIEVATGTYTNSMYSDEQGNAVPIQGRVLENAEDTNIYRIRDFWGVEGYNLMFTWDQATNFCEFVNASSDTGYYYASAGANVHVMDAKSYYLVYGGEEYTWEFLVSNEFIRPHYDPATMTFNFEFRYMLPDIGAGFDGWWLDTFTLDGEVAAPVWNQVATGSYGTIFQDQNGDQFIVPGVKMENKEGSNQYRLYDPWYNEGDYYLNFAWDQQTNLVDIIGFNDSGNPATIFGAPASAGNAMICDVLTFYTQMAGQVVTWEDLKKQYGETIQSAYDPATATFSFVVCYAFPELGSIVNNSFFKETYTLDSTAAPTSAPVLRKVSSEAIPMIKFTQDYSRKCRIMSTEKVQLANVKKSVNSIKTVTPVKREMTQRNIEKAF